MTTKKSNPPRPGLPIADQRFKRSALGVFLILIVAVAAALAWRCLASSPALARHSLQDEVNATASEASAKGPTQRTLKNNAVTVAEALAAREALSEVLDDELAEKLADGGPWELRDLPHVGESLVRVERFIDVNGPRLSEAASLEVQRSYLELQRVHNELLLQSGILPEPSKEGLRRKAESAQARRALEESNKGLSDVERAEKGAALKELMMRTGEPAGQKHGGLDTGETK